MNGRGRGRGGDSSGIMVGVVGVASQGMLAGGKGGDNEWWGFEIGRVRASVLVTDAQESPEMPVWVVQAV